MEALKEKSQTNVFHATGVTSSSFSSRGDDFFLVLVQLSTVWCCSQMFALRQGIPGHLGNFTHAKFFSYNSPKYGKTLRSKDSVGKKPVLCTFLCPLFFSIPGCMLSKSRGIIYSKEHHKAVCQSIMLPGLAELWWLMCLPTQSSHRKNGICQKFVHSLKNPNL